MDKKTICQNIFSSYLSKWRLALGEEVGDAALQVISVNENPEVLQSAVDAGFNDLLEK